MPTLLRPANSHTVVSTGWTNPSNAYATSGDDVYATTLNGSTTKNLSHSGDFGFANIASDAIPDGSEIIEVRMVAEVNLTAQVPGGVFGIQGALSGTLQDSEVTKTGAGEDLLTFTFSTPPTLSQLRSASTVVRARCRGAKGNTANALTVQLDYVRLEVDYEELAEPQHYDRTSADSGSVSEEPDRVLGAGRASSDTVSTSDSLDHVHLPGADQYERSVSDTVSASESIEHTHAFPLHFDRFADDTVVTLDEIGPMEEVQTATAISDVAIDGWTGEDARTTDLYTSVAGTDDGTYAQSPSDPVAADVFEVLLGALDDPQTDEGHVIRYRYSGNGVSDLWVDLVQGTSVLTSWSHTTPGETVQQAAQPLPEAIAAQITDYSDLRLRFRGA